MCVPSNRNQEVPTTCKQQFHTQKATLQTSFCKHRYCYCLPPNHPMALHLLWDKSKTLSRSHQGFRNLAPQFLCYHLLLLPSHPGLVLSSCSAFHSSGSLHSSSHCLGSFSPILLQASPHWFCKTQFNWKPSATLPRILQQRWALPSLWPHRTLHIPRYILFFMALTTLYFNYLFTQSLPKDWVAPKTVRVEEMKWEVGSNIRAGRGTVHLEAYPILNLVKDRKYVLFSVRNTKSRKFSSSKSWMNTTPERFPHGVRASSLCLF